MSKLVLFTFVAFMIAACLPALGAERYDTKGFNLVVEQELATLVKCHAINGDGSYKYPGACGQQYVFNDAYSRDRRQERKGYVNLPVKGEVYNGN